MNMTPTTDRLSDRALEIVAGGLNPQPLPPEPPDMMRSIRTLNISRFSIARFFSFGR
jgi:hypothetical protein